MALSTPAFDSKVGLAFASAAVVATTVVGVTILAAVSTQIGRYLQYQISCDDIEAAETVTLNFQGLKEDGTTWETILDSAGNALSIAYADGSELDGGTIKATLPIFRLGQRATNDEESYIAWRVSATQAGGNGNVVFGSYSILDLYDRPNAQVDAVARLLHPRN